MGYLCKSGFLAGGEICFYRSSVVGGIDERIKKLVPRTGFDLDRLESERSLGVLGVR
jgi:hypothetical protein